MLHCMHWFISGTVYWWLWLCYFLFPFFFLLKYRLFNIVVVDCMHWFISGSVYWWLWLCYLFFLFFILFLKYILSNVVVVDSLKKGQPGALELPHMQGKKKNHNFVSHTLPFFVFCCVVSGGARIFMKPGRKKICNTFIGFYIRNCKQIIKILKKLSNL